MNINFKKNNLSKKVDFMSEKNIQVYGYRWIVLLLFMFANIVMQFLWISYAAVSASAALYYGQELIMIDLLSLTFMVVYIPVTFISAWVIDKYDFRIGAGIGALLAGIFGLLRFFAFNNYSLVLIFQIGIAVGQPFILNAVTKLSANWFPEDERTMATGLALLSQFLGIAICMILSPVLVVGSDLGALNLVYGIIALIAGVLFVIFVRDRPPTPPSTKISTEKVMMTEGLKTLFKNKQFVILTVGFLILLGIFNTVLTLILQIVSPRGHGEDFAGTLGGLILVGGIIGSIVFSGLSDKLKKRKILILISLSISLVSMYIISFTSDATLLSIFGFLFGFGILGAAPVALEFAVDITKPVPEASSNGMLMMFGQVGGIIFILGLSGLTIPPTNDLLPALIIQAILFTITLILFVWFIKEE